MAYYPVKLIYNSYIPDQLEVGMLFAVSVTINEHSYLHVHKLDKLPRNVETFLQENGQPVKPYLIRAIDSNPDVPPEIVAYPDQIGWFEQDNMLYEFDVDGMNYVSAEDDGYIAMYMDDENLEPILEDGKVVLTSMDYLWAMDDEDEDYSDWDVTLQDGLEDL